MTNPDDGGMMEDEALKERLDRIETEVQTRAKNGTSLWMRIIGATLGVFLIPAFGVAVTFGNMESELENAKERSKKNQAEIKSVDKKVTTLSERLKGIEGEIERVRSNMQRFESTLKTRHKDLMNAIEEDKQ